MKGLAAFFGVGVAGVFVGALAMEVIHRVRPNLVREMTDGTKKAFSDMGVAFKEGYRGLPAEEPPEVSN